MKWVTCLNSGQMIQNAQFLKPLIRLPLVTHDLHIVLNPIRLGQAMTVNVTSALTGKQILKIESPNAGWLYGRHIKESVSKGIGAPSPFCIQLLIEQEKLNDFTQLKDCTETRELALSLVYQKRRRPTTKEYETLAEAIGNNYAQLVWRILAKGLVLVECIPTHGRMMVNPLVLSLQSPYMEVTSDVLLPNVKCLRSPASSQLWPQ